MSFRIKIVYFLVHKLAYTNKEAGKLIREGRVLCNNEIVLENIVLHPEDLLTVNGVVVKEPDLFDYVLLNKPRGVECTMNEGIQSNLKNLLIKMPYNNLFPIGRLDKDSEGLLMLTNDGRLMNKTIWAHNKIEKEYLVESEDVLDDDFLLQLRNGVNLSGAITAVERIQIVNLNVCEIVLREGKNRQIRRMFYKCNKQIKSLKRTRWHNFILGDLKPGEWRELNNEEKNEIQKLVRFNI